VAPPLLPLTVGRHRITIGKKKHDSEASDSGTKKVERTHRMPLPVDEARLMHRN
jgi:hypothetical protein